MDVKKGPPANPAKALVVPFHGERYDDSTRLSARLAPPYDVIDPDAWAQLAELDEHNVVRLILPESNGDRYRRAAQLLKTWRARGILIADSKSSVTVVQQEFRDVQGVTRRRTGVIGAVAVEPFTARRVRPHERTHAEPKADRLALLRATETMFDALFMLAPDPEEVLHRQLASATATPPTAVASLGDGSMSVWHVGDAASDSLASAASRHPLYIADGHHRYETAIAYAEENRRADRTLALIVPLRDPGLIVQATHRLVLGSDVDAERALGMLRKRFRIRELGPDDDHLEALVATQDRGTACVLILPQRRFVLLLRGSVGIGDLPSVDHTEVAKLDVARVDGLAVNPVLELAGPNSTLTYTADPAAAIRAVREQRISAAILMNPPSIQQVLDVADTGGVMPQKSTYFAPKVPSGVVFLPYVTESPR